MPARAALWTVSVLLCRVNFVEIHGPDNQRVFVNEAEVSALRTPTKSDLEHYFSGSVHCIVTTTNGKFIAARESCDLIRDRLAGSQR